MKHTENWHNKRVLILGFGNEGHANLAYAARCGAKEIAVADQSTEIILSPNERACITKCFTGVDWLQGLYDYDIILRSPGVPIHCLVDVQKAAPHIQITSGTNIFLSHHSAKTIGVTGTKGKSTTSSLIHHLLVTAGIDSQLCGNIGIPAITLLDSPSSLFVLELSSYQLADISTSPSTAIYLNLYPEHLDYHGDFESYAQAKSRIGRFQAPQDRLILPCDSTALIGMGATKGVNVTTWGTRDSAAWIEQDAFYHRCQRGLTHHLCKVTDAQLRGPGNHRNILAALAAVTHLRIPPDALAQAITSFYPLPHRLEVVATQRGITYINDSISTVPQATINALETFGSDVRTVILGGYDRGICFEQLTDYLLCKTQIETVILFSPSGRRIEQSLKDHPFFLERTLTLLHADTMAEAVRLAASHTPQKAICLLSPASPSFPLFKNFAERGQLFCQEVRTLR